MVVAERRIQVNYSEIFDEEIVNLFKEKEILDKLIVTEDDFSINIDKLIELLNIKVIEESSEDDFSGKLNFDEHTIYLNKNHSDNRKRFTKAHELAHFLYGHKGSNHRTQNLSSYTSVEDFENERIANAAAANILMPRIQVEVLYEVFLSNNDLNMDSPLNSLQKDELFDFISKKLQVSKSAVSYRLINLGIL